MMNDLTLEEINWIIAESLRENTSDNEEMDEGAVDETMDENFILQPGDNSDDLSECTDDNQPKAFHK